MGIEPPFIYDLPSSYAFPSPTEKFFNPKAVTHASWEPQPPKPSFEGPLINAIEAKETGRHPDSYHALPYGNTDWKPMGPNTKAKVKWTRLLQLLLRICALVASVGLLVCVIIIKPAGDESDWLIRIPPAAAVLHAIYAIYNLVPSPTTRTPDASASYMVFAGVADAALIPFFVFTALVSHTALLDVEENVEGHWETLLEGDAATRVILFWTWLLAVVTGGIMLVCLCISVYLALLFRNISNLPPEMNPLEDNLTGRKHKRNKSSISTAIGDVPNTRDSHLSMPLIEGGRNVPSMHSRDQHSPSFTDTQRPSTHARADSDHSLTPPRPPHHSLRDPGFGGTSPERYSPPNARSSRFGRAPTLPYQHPAGDRSSRTELLLVPSSPSKSPYLTEHGNWPLPNPSPSPSPALSSDDNWFAHPSPPSSPPPPPPRQQRPLERTLPEFRHLRTAGPPSITEPTTTYSPLPQEAATDDDDRPRHDFRNRAPKPLAMNPPTPTAELTFSSARNSAPPAHQGSNLRPSSTTVTTTTAGTPPTDQWSDIHLAGNDDHDGDHDGDLGSSQASGAGAGAATYRSDRWGSGNVSSKARFYGGLGARERQQQEAAAPVRGKRAGDNISVDNGGGGGGGSRVVSSGMERREGGEVRSRARDVSGKVVEEGRGAGSGGGARW